MNHLKMKVLQELLGHLDEMQGMKMKSAYEKEKGMGAKPFAGKESLEEEMAEHEMLEGKKPKGIAVEKVEIMAKPKKAAMMDEEEAKEDAPEIEATPKGEDQEDELDDEEMAELLAKYLG
jgi:hypothetical protein